VFLINHHALSGGRARRGAEKDNNNYEELNI